MMMLNLKVMKTPQRLSLQDGTKKKLAVFMRLIGCVQICLYYMIMNVLRNHILKFGCHYDHLQSPLGVYIDS